MRCYAAFAALVLFVTSAAAPILKSSAPPLLPHAGLCPNGGRAPTPECTPGGRCQPQRGRLVNLPSLTPATRASSAELSFRHGQATHSRATSSRSRRIQPQTARFVMPMRLAIHGWPAVLAMPSRSVRCEIAVAALAVASVSARSLAIRSSHASLWPA